jgi:hypothetical protein
MALTANVAASTLGDNTVVAGVAGKRIRVLSWALSAPSAVNAKWRDGAGGTDKTGLFSLGAGLEGRDGDGRFAFECADGNGLVLNLSAAVATGGVVRYAILPSAGYRAP